MAAYEIDQERYIFGSYDSVDWDFIYHDVKENVTSWLEKLDKLIHVPFRLGILSVLYKNRILSFAILKQVLNATSGNLNNHLTSLHRSNLIEIQKSISGSRPITLISITEKGKERYEKYVSSFHKAFEEIQL
ncbi:MAG: transcriptional regulator [Candidatus Hodarchaeales archaeon]|jgi:DNA-binding MarR family transcriptional regulator